MLICPTMEMKLLSAPDYERYYFYRKPRNIVDEIQRVEKEREEVRAILEEWSRFLGESML